MGGCKEGDESVRHRGRERERRYDVEGKGKAKEGGRYM